MNRAVFIDRDGTITKSTALVTHRDAIVLEGAAADGIKIMNGLGLKVIVVTNQPQVARGLCSEDDVRNINNKMVDDLKREGAHVDAVYFCPHHPEMHEDVPEHAKKYRIPCNCRKPAAGMLKKAADDFSIDLSKSFMIGDRTVDIQTGKNAGCTTILVKTGDAGMDGKHAVNPDFYASDLLAAAKIIRRSSMKIKAVILAGGRGERLKPLTDTMPKPMIEIAGKPVLQHQIEALRKAGVSEIILCGSYLVDKIKDYFGSGERFGVKIFYPEEPTPLGSGGAIKNASAFLEDADRFFVLNGDIMIDSSFDFSRALDFDQEKNGIVTMMVHETDHPRDSDAIGVGDDNRILKFIGKGQDTHKMTNIGMFISGPALLGYIPDGPNNIEQDVLSKLAKDGNMYAFIKPVHWFSKDMGTAERLKKVRDHFEMNS
jgi:histidinol-phosphate phosphatase family protein